MGKTIFHYRSYLTISSTYKEQIMFFNLLPVHDKYVVQILTENQKKVNDDKTLNMPYKTMAKLNSVAPDTLKRAKKV